MKVVFMGTPEFSARFLSYLAERGEHEIVAVVTQPDRPAGRGRHLHEPPVKVLAQQLGLPVWQPSSVRDSVFHKELTALKADISVVVAFSLLPHEVLAATRLGAVNVHGSLLPKYRGAAPVQWAIASGEHHTGVTVFLLDRLMDHGPILCQRTVDIHPMDTAATVLENMVEPGCAALQEALDLLGSPQELRPLPQDDTRASPARKLRKEDGVLDWNESARHLHDRIRAFSPWPGGYGYLLGTRIFLRRTHPQGEGDFHMAPGELRMLPDKRVVVGTGSGWLEILELQAEGKKTMAPDVFLRGWHGPTDSLCFDPA